MLHIISEDQTFSAALRVILREFDTEENTLDLLDADSVENFERRTDLPAVPLVVFSRKTENFPDCNAFFMRPFENRALRDKAAELLGGLPESAASCENVDTKGLVFDGEENSVSVGKNKVVLTGAEFRLLSMLWSADGEAVTRESAGEIFGATATNVVDVYISYLRRKLDRLPGAPKILTVRGVGYSITGTKGECSN